MNTSKIANLERELEEVTIALTASEGWAKSWVDMPEFKDLLKSEAKLEKAMRDYFRDLAGQIGKVINWKAYKAEIAKRGKEVEAAGEFKQAAVQLVVKNALNLIDDPRNEKVTSVNLYSGIKEIFINGVALGYQAQITQLAKDNALAPTLNMAVESPITKALQDAAQAHVEQLADYLDPVTSDKVVSAIQESMALGESSDLAAERLSSVIDDSDRAELVAQTEMPRSFAEGEATFAEKNGATSKTWEALDGADTDKKGKVQDPAPCLDNDGQTVDIDDNFPSGDAMNPAHPRCRCKVNYNYPDDMAIDIAV